MSTAETLLPAGFEALEPFLDHWLVPSASKRAEARITSTPQQRADFYTAANVLFSSALEYLDQRPLDRLNEQEQRLMGLMLSFGHVAYAVEIQRENEAKHSQLRRHLKITRAPADFSASPQERPFTS